MVCHMGVSRNKGPSHRAFLVASSNSENSGGLRKALIVSGFRKLQPAVDKSAQECHMFRSPHNFWKLGRMTDDKALLRGALKGVSRFFCFSFQGFIGIHKAFRGFCRALRGL